jgi:hypothetical protein
MPTDPSRVVVTPGATAESACVYHRDFPEIRADGETPRVAAVHLANHLARALDSALTDWRRQTLDLAVADVRAFADSPQVRPARNDHT